MVEGAHLLEAFLDNTRRVPETILVCESSAMEPEIGRLLERATGVTAVAVEDRLFAKLSPVAGRNGVLAVIAIEEPPFDAVIADAGFQLWLDAIQDPGNVGSLIRTAAASGATAVILGPGCADAWSPKCLRGGMGGHFAIPVASVPDLVTAADQWGGRLLVADARASGRVFDLDLRGDVAIVLGGEATGVQPTVTKRATGTFAIPMPGAVESLNVGAAGAVVCFERLRQALAIER